MRRWSLVAAEVAATTMTSAKTAILAAYLASLDERELPIAAVLLAGRPFPGSDQRTLGIALRFPRIARLRPDRPAADADTLSTVERLFEGLQHGAQHLVAHPGRASAPPSSDMRWPHGFTGGRRHVQPVPLSCLQATPHLGGVPAPEEPCSPPSMSLASWRLRCTQMPW